MTTPYVVFLKLCFLEREGVAQIFRDFYTFSNYIFHESFIEIHHLVQKIWRFSSSILAIFTIFQISWHLFVEKKLMTSAYNKWRQHFFSFKLLWIHAFFYKQRFFQPSLSVAWLFHELRFKCCLGVA